jgi:hypothetical protein
MWGRTRTLTSGLLGEIEEAGGLTKTSLRGHIERGGTLLVPIDIRVSPWPAPKLFALSHKQAIDLLDAMGPEAETRITYVVRSDGSVALIRRDHADTSSDCLPAGGPDAVQGTQDHDPR